METQMLEGGHQELSYRDGKLCNGYRSEDVEEKVGYASLEYVGEVWSRDMNLGFINF